MATEGREAGRMVPSPPTGTEVPWPAAAVKAAGLKQSLGRIGGAAVEGKL